MKAHGYLEQVKDFTYEGKLIPASRLGWRITPLFASTYLGRIFDTPAAVFSEDILRPELQSMPEFVDGILNIAEAQAKVAKAYLEDGSVASAIPPLAAILHIMAEGSWEGKGPDSPEVRKLFTRDYVISSSWYRERLEGYKKREASYLENSENYLKVFLAQRNEPDTLVSRRAKADLDKVDERLSYVRGRDFLKNIDGTIGLDPLFRGRK